MVDLQEIADSEALVKGKPGEYVLSQSPGCGMALHINCPVCGTRNSYIGHVSEAQPLTLARPFTCQGCRASISIDSGVAKAGGK